MAVLWLCLLTALGSSHGARILGVFPSPSISHQLPFQAVMKALATRGHQVTVISTDPLKSPHPNYTDVDLSFTYKVSEFETIKDAVQQGTGFFTPYRMIPTFREVMAITCRAQLSSDVLQNFIKSDQQFDLMFIESFPFNSMLGLAHVVGSPPVIAILSYGGMSHNFEIMGNPVNPAVDPDNMLPYDDHKTFWERVNNFVYWTWTKYYFENIMAREMEEISKYYFGNDVPSVYDSEKNYSLMMLNNHWSMSYPRPIVPGIIELGNLHLQIKTNPLPKDIKEFLDGATEGFIYFSLGSNIRSDKLPEEKRNEFLKAFAELPQRVLWKWESDSLPGQPKNVMVSKWLPQQDILAHPNIRLFITQGGLQSTNEATHNGVPIVGIPFAGDQPFNVKKVINAGAGLKIDFETATKDVILTTLRQIITDPSYQANMKELSAITKDQPETPLDRAVWWTEYVLRHKGAKHLRPAALDLAWYQYLLLDVILFLITCALTVSYLCWFIVKRTLRLICNTKCCDSNMKNENLQKKMK